MKAIQKTTYPLGVMVVLALGLANAPAEIYRYDVVGRLTKVTYDDGSSLTHTYDNNGNLVFVESRAVASDINANGRVELSDFARLQVCFTGTGGGPVTPGCESADLNGNGTVDLDDFAQFHSSMTGP